MKNTKSKYIYKNYILIGELRYGNKKIKEQTKPRKTLNADILKYEIDVYCATMADFWNYKEDAMYKESKEAIYTIISLMVYYMGYKEAELLDFARKKLNAYVLTDGNKITTDIVYKEI